jgi:hypothetical protein
MPTDQSVRVHPTSRPHTRRAGLAGVEAVDAAVLRAVAALAAALVPQVEGAKALAGGQALVVPLVCGREGAGQQRQGVTNWRHALHDRPPGAGGRLRAASVAAVTPQQPGAARPSNATAALRQQGRLRLRWQLLPLGQDWPG